MLFTFRKLNEIFKLLINLFFKIFFLDYLKFDKFFYFLSTEVKLKTHIQLIYFSFKKNLIYNNKLYLSKFLIRLILSLLIYLFIN